MCPGRGRGAAAEAFHRGLKAGPHAAYVAATTELGYQPGLGPLRNCACGSTLIHPLDVEPDVEQQQTEAA